MRVNVFTYTILTIVTRVFVQSDIVLSPYGIKMCKLKCEESIGCQKFAFLQQDLTCCVGAGDNNSACVNGSATTRNIFQLFKHSVSNCQINTRIITANDTRTTSKDELPSMGDIYPPTKRCLSLFQNLNGANAEFEDAVTNEDAEKVLCMLSQLVVVNMTWAHEYTPVLLSANRGHKEMYENLVLQGCDVTARKENGGPAFHAVCSGGNMHILKTLIRENRVNKEELRTGGIAQLLVSIFYPKIEMFKYLVSELNCFCN